MTEKDKYIGQSKLLGKPDKPLKFKLGDKIVKAKHIDNGAVTPEHLSDSVETIWFKKMYAKYIQPVVDTLMGKINGCDDKYKGITDELYSMIRSIQVGGIALSDRLGNREDIGVTQKALTDIINSLNTRIDDIAGEYTRGFSMTVTPDAFISEDTCEVNITAQMSTGLFEHIAFYLDDVLLVEGDKVSSLTRTTTIDKTTEVKCIATIMGIEYTKRHTVTKYYPFFIGGGNSLEEALTPENARTYDGSLAGGYDVEVKENQRIYVLIPLSIQSQVVRMDMNGFEIPMDRYTDGRNVIYVTQNRYKAGTLNIDITNNEADVSLADLEKIDALFDEEN